MKYKETGLAANLREKVFDRSAGRGEGGGYEDDVIKYGKYKLNELIGVLTGPELGMVSFRVIAKRSIGIHRTSRIRVHRYLMTSPFQRYRWSLYVLTPTRAVYTHAH